VYLLGSKEDIGHLGYVPGRCPKCGEQGMLSVYQAKKKITFAALVSVPMADQLMAECLKCHTRMAIPDAMKDEIGRNMVSSADLAGIATSRAKAGGTFVGDGRTNVRTAYQVLQVDSEAEPEVIQAAFKRLAFKYHPDRSEDPGAEERMRELSAAHDLLTDEVRKSHYDASLGLVREPKRPRAMRSDDV
jgi:DnaJ domain